MRLLIVPHTYPGIQVTYESTGVLPRAFRRERAVSPADVSPMWVVVDEDFDLQPDAAAAVPELPGTVVAAHRLTGAISGPNR